MNFLTKTLGTLTGYSIPYTFGDVIDSSVSEDSSSTSLWKIYDGVSDKDSIPVTIFEFDLKNQSIQRFTPLIQNAIARHRALSLLPGVLSIVEVIESDRFIYLITERVRPLSRCLGEYKNDTKILGIYQLSEAINYINIQGTSVHGNLNISNVYVTESAEWKIGGFEFAFRYDNSSDFRYIFSMYGNLNSNKRFPPEYETNGSDCFNSQLSGAKSIKFDSYLFGLLIFEIINGRQTSGSEVAKSNNLQGLPVNKLVAPSVGLRMTIEQFMKNGESTYFATDEIIAYSKFAQIALLDNNEKLEIFKRLVYGNVPIQFLENKVQLELMRTFDQTTNNENNLQTIIIYLMFSIVKRSEKSTESSSFNRFFKPVFFKSFTLADRAIRTILLKILPQVVSQIDKYEIQDKIYPNLVNGFQDTDITVRTETLLSISCIMDKITDRQLNNDLLRYLAKLQADLNPQLRANTVICLTKISEKMQPNTRIGVLITAFGKALRDADHVTRLSAVRGFKSSIDYFEPEICCSKVLSALAPALLEKSSVIRSEAEETFELYMKKIRDASAILSSTEEDRHINEDVDKLNDLMKNLSLENLGESLVGSISNLPTPSGTPFPESRMNTNNFTKSALQSTENLVSNDDGFDFGDADDGWGIDDDDETFDNNVTQFQSRPSEPSRVQSTPTFGNVSAKAATTIPTKKLVLGKQKAAKVSLNISAPPVVVDDDDDGWGDGW